MEAGAKSLEELCKYIEGAFENVSSFVQDEKDGSRQKVRILLFGSVGSGKTAIARGVFEGLNQESQAYRDGFALYKSPKEFIEVWDSPSMVFGESWDHYCDRMDCFMAEQQEHCHPIELVWFVINGTGNIEPGQIDVIQKFEQRRAKVLVVLTKCDSLTSDQIDSHLKHLHERGIEQENVVHIDGQSSEGLKLEGLGDLVRRSHKLLPESRRMGFIRGQMANVSLKIEEYVRQAMEVACTQVQMQAYDSESKGGFCKAIMEFFGQVVDSIKDHNRLSAENKRVKEYEERFKALLKKKTHFWCWMFLAAQAILFVLFKTAQFWYGNSSLALYVIFAILSCAAFFFLPTTILNLIFFHDRFEEAYSRGNYKDDVCKAPGETVQEEPVVSSALARKVVREISFGWVFSGTYLLKHPFLRDVVWYGALGASRAWVKDKGKSLGKWWHAKWRKMGA